MIHRHVVEQKLTKLSDALKVEENEELALPQHVETATGQHEPTDSELWWAIKAAGLEQGVYLPSSYKKESSMNLAPPALTDTTNRSLVKNWQKLTGMRDSGELWQGLYYLTPYLTCERCNGLVFINAQRTFGARAVATMGLSQFFPSELLQACPGCGLTDKFRPGAYDLLQQIARSKDELLHLLRKRRVAALILCRGYRFYLRRAAGRAERCVALTRRLLVNRCAAVMASAARGRLGRRRAFTVRRLLVIRNAHPISIKRATCGDGDVWGNRRVPQWYKDELAGPTRRRHVFWYKSNEQLALLHHDYLDLCARLGYIPPRFVVEANIYEISRRIELRMARLIAAVQSRWRALTVRKLLLDFLRERTVWREVRAAAAFRISRQCRGWIARRRDVARRRDAVFRNKILGAYIRERQAKASSDRRSICAKALDAAYRKERREERTARYCGLVIPCAKGSCKINSFRESAYGSTRAMNCANQVAKGVAAEIARNQAENAAFQKRGRWLETKCESNSTFAVYYQDELRARSQEIIRAVASRSNDTSLAFNERAVSLLRRHNGANKPRQHPSSLGPIRTPGIGLNSATCAASPQLPSSSSQAIRGNTTTHCRPRSPQNLL